jgi:hypothetical protein
MQKLPEKIWVRDIALPEQVEIGEYILSSQFPFLVRLITKTYDENYNVYFLFENRKGSRVKFYEWQIVDVLRRRINNPGNNGVPC